MVTPTAVAVEQHFTNEADARAAAYDKQMEVHANGSSLNMDALKEAYGIITGLGGCTDLCNSNSGQLSYASVGEKQSGPELEFNPFV
ncbi:MAG: hypothetical protein MRY32_00600 [Rickettsiales bacterium]|nr:hypothetical protein [Rickettsiales bacterium]